MPNPAMAQAGRLLAVLALFSVPGCADPWAAYEDSLYKALRVPGAAAYGEHADVLRQFVESYEGKNQKPPPGIHAEYGFYLARLGKAEEARRQFKAEMEAYPESAAFVAALERTVEGHRAFQPASQRGIPGADARKVD
jgi:hypothetical protein